MKYLWSHFGIMLAVWLLQNTITEISGKSVQIHTANSRRTNAMRPHEINYSKLKRSRPHQRQPTVFPQKRNKVIQSQRNVLLETRQGFADESENVVPDVIQSTFDTGFKSLFEFIRRYFSRFMGPTEGVENPAEIEETSLRIPGLPTTSLVQHFDASKIVKLLQATDGSQVEILAEEAVVDLVSQLVGIIGFNDLRDWLSIILMYFILGPILIPLFWLPISLFGMAGLLVPLFLFNPPSKLNTGVLGHDPILPEEAAEIEIRSLSSFSFYDGITTPPPTLPKQSSSTTIGLSRSDHFESCMERISCHLTRLYRANPITQWLTSRYNATTVEWARRHPEDDNNGNWTSSWEHCTKYACPIFPAA